MKALLSPSLLSSDFANLGQELHDLAKAGITWVHWDVMDGVFVPNITFGPPVIGRLRQCSQLFFDVHLMIVDPIRHLDAFVRAGADILVPHLETLAHPQRALAAIKESGVRAGVALNPDTEITRLRYLLPYIDMVLILGVNPGFSGQSFLPLTLAKVRACRQFLEEESFGHLPIQVDGGADLGNAAQLVEAGANVLVSGSAFFSHSDDAMAVGNFDQAVAASGPSCASAKATQTVAHWSHAPH